MLVYHLQFSPPESGVRASRSIVGNTSIGIAFLPLSPRPLIGMALHKPYDALIHLPANEMLSSASCQTQGITRVALR